MTGQREKTGGVLAPEELGASLERVAATTDLDIREGRFQRWLALISALSSALSGVEVAYEHYKGSYSRRVMYTPVILSGALVAGGLVGFFQQACRAHDSTGRLGSYTRRLRRGFLLPCSRNPSEARGMATAYRQHGYGSARVCSAAVWRQRISRFSRVSSSSR